jgi:hypothetical protein
MTRLLETKFIHQYCVSFLLLDRRDEESRNYYRSVYLGQGKLMIKSTGRQQRTPQT